MISRSKGVAFLISSHMMSEMEAVCNRIGILCGGELVREGDVRQLLDGGVTMEQFYLSSVEQWKGGGIHA